jgi:acyl-CoA reductase-like NAD-dependent aldehyde dehydrogenase
MKPSENESGRPTPVRASELVNSPRLAELRRAQTAWAKESVPARLKIIRRFRGLLAEQAQLVAHSACSAEHRPVSEVLAAEILPLAEACRFLERSASAVLAPRRVGRAARPIWLAGVHSEIHREPFGVVLVIAPSNYPVLLPGVQVLQALVAGNAVQLKPGPGGLAPALQIHRLLHLAGLPENLLWVLPESADAARAAIAAGVDKVFFTGSAAVGRKILSDLAPQAVPAVMELSGADAVLIRADADLDLAARAVAFGLRLNAGQTCIAPRRLLVARSVATEFEGRLEAVLRDTGAVFLTDAQQAKLSPLVHRALGDGAHLLAGEAPAEAPLIGPLVLAGVKPDAAWLGEDIFGPLTAVITVADDAEAVAVANASAFGLGATVFSRDAGAARELAARLQCGVVLINDLIAPTADPRLPFGGRKLSGFGSTRGREGLLEMTTPKVVIINRSRTRPHFDPPRTWHERLFCAFLQLIHGQGWRSRLAAMRSLTQAIRQSRRPESR